MVQIETERTFLRLPTIADLDDLSVIFANPQVMKYMDADCQPLTRVQTEMALVSIINGWKKNGFGRWVVISKESDKLIGLAGLRKHEEIAELFYVLDEHCWGKGFATEIARQILKVGFEIYNFSQIVAMTRPANFASRRVLSKLRMNFIGELDIYGISAVQYTISKQEYQLT